MRYTDLAPAISLAAAIFAIQLNAAVQPGIQVGINIQVSKSNGDLEHNEVFGCADSRNPARMLVASIFSSMNEWSPRTALYASLDGGKTWSTGVTSSAIHLDPACAYGSDDDAYFISSSGKLAERFILFYRSEDGGRSWSQAAPIVGGGDRPYVVVDSHQGKDNSRIYVNSGVQLDNLDPSLFRDEASSRTVTSIGLFRSLDRGKSFLGPMTTVGPVATLSTSKGQYRALQNLNSVVLSDGTVVTLLCQFEINENREATGSLKILRSFNGGESYSDPIKIGDYYSDWSLFSSKDTVPNIAVDPGSRLFKDRLYAVWHNTKKDSKGKSVGEISLVSYSTDKGQTWSTPSQIGNPPENGGEYEDEYQTTVTVNRDGVVGVMWYDGFEDQTSMGYWVRFTASVDGGQTWLPSVRVSEAPSKVGGTEGWPLHGWTARSKEDGNFKICVRTRIWESSGHTAGLVADANGVFHAFWVDDRTGIKQVWTAPIAIMGSVTKNGAQELANLDDLSSKVEIKISNISLNRATGKLSVTLRLKNISERTIASPLKMRIFNLHSEFGIPRVSNAGNGRFGVPAILDLSDFVSGAGTLRPNQESSEKLMEFEIEHLGPLRSDGNWHKDLLTLDTKLFGKLLQ